MSRNRIVFVSYQPVIDKRRGARNPQRCNGNSIIKILNSLPLYRWLSRETILFKGFQRWLKRKKKEDRLRTLWKEFAKILGYCMNFTIPYDAISSGPGGYRGLVCRRSGWISRYDPGHWDVAPTAADAGRLSPWQQPRCTHRGDAHMQTRPACTWKPVHAVARIRCFVHTLHTQHRRHGTIALAQQPRTT